MSTTIITYFGIFGIYKNVPFLNFFLSDDKNGVTLPINVRHFPDFPLSVSAFVRICSNF